MAAFLGLPGKLINEENKSKIVLNSRAVFIVYETVHIVQTFVTTCYIEKDHYSHYLAEVICMSP